MIGLVIFPGPVVLVLPPQTAVVFWKEKEKSRYAYLTGYIALHKDPLVYYDGHCCFEERRNARLLQELLITDGIGIKR